jgi:hypothetical protein
LIFISSPKRSLTHRIRQFVESRDVLSGLFLQCNYFSQSNSVSFHPDRFAFPTARLTQIPVFSGELALKRGDLGLQSLVRSSSDRDLGRLATAQKTNNNRKVKSANRSLTGGNDRGYGTHVSLQAVELFLGHDEIQDDGEYTGQEDGQEESSSRQVH